MMTLVLPCLTVILTVILDAWTSPTSTLDIRTWFFSTYTKISVFRQKRARSLAFMTDDATAHGTVLLQLEQDGLRRK